MDEELLNCPYCKSKSLELEVDSSSKYYFDKETGWKFDRVDTFDKFRNLNCTECGKDSDNCDLLEVRLNELDCLGLD